MNKEEIFNTLQSTISELFEIDKEKITLQTNIFEDLDLDSIDFIDLAVKIHEITGKRVNPEEFKKVKTMQDLVDASYDLYKI